MGNRNSRNTYKQQYVYYPNNKINAIIKYKNGVLHGKQCIFTEDDKKKITIYKNGVYVDEYWESDKNKLNIKSLLKYK